MRIYVLNELFINIAVATRGLNDGTIVPLYKIKKKENSYSLGWHFDEIYHRSNTRVIQR